MALRKLNYVDVLSEAEERAICPGCRVEKTFHARRMV